MGLAPADTFMITGARTSRRGFTFLELLITIILLVLGVVPVIGTLAAGVAADQRIEGYVLALALAQEGMESVKAVSFDSVVEVSRSAVSGFSGYERAVAISGDDPKQVTVSVYWTLKGQEQQVSLDTLITDLEPGA